MVHFRGMLLNQENSTYAILAGPVMLHLTKVCSPIQNQQIPVTRSCLVAYPSIFGQHLRCENFEQLESFRKLYAMLKLEQKNL